MEDWPELGGSMRYEPEHLKVDHQQLNMLMEHMYMSLYKLDRTIEWFAYALQMVQPHAPGKITIRFLKRPWGGTTGHRHPQLVQWYRTSNGRWLYNRLKTNEALRKVKGYAVFAPVKEEIKIVLEEAISTINRREALFDAINNFKRQLSSMLVRNEKYVEEQRAIAKDWLGKLRLHRANVLERRLQAIMAASQGLPPDAVADMRKVPRVDLAGRTRGHIHLTRRGRG